MDTWQEPNIPKVKEKKETEEKFCLRCNYNNFHKSKECSHCHFDKFSSEPIQPVCHVFVAYSPF